MQTLTVGGLTKKVIPLWQEGEIKARVSGLAREIADDYLVLLKQEQQRDLVLVGVLNGAVPFLADLARELTELLPAGRMRYDTLAISSYGRGTTHGELRIEKDLKDPVRGHFVLIVEDIIDSGYTFAYLEQLFEYKKAHNVKICTLIDKISRREKECQPDFVGFKLKEDLFVVGYGLDWDTKGRTLSFIARLEDSTS